MAWADAEMMLASGTSGLRYRSHGTWHLALACVEEFFLCFVGLDRGLRCQEGSSRGAKVVGILLITYPGAVLYCNIMARGLWLGTLNSRWAFDSPLIYI